MISEKEKSPFWRFVSLEREDAFGKTRENEISLKASEINKMLDKNQRNGFYSVFLPKIFYFFYFIYFKILIRHHLSRTMNMTITQDLLDEYKDTVQPALFTEEGLTVEIKKEKEQELNRTTEFWWSFGINVVVIL